MFISTAAAACVSLPSLSLYRHKLGEWGYSICGAPIEVRVKNKTLVCVSLHSSQLKVDREHDHKSASRALSTRPGSYICVKSTALHSLDVELIVCLYLLLLCARSFSLMLWYLSAVQISLHVQLIVCCVCGASYFLISGTPRAKRTRASPCYTHCLTSRLIAVRAVIVALSSADETNNSGVRWSLR